MSVAPRDLIDDDWRADALCARSENPEIFFAPGALEHKIAKSICRLCPVRRQCLIYAMEAQVDYGVWGGLTERERRGFRRKRGDGELRLRLVPD